MSLIEKINVAENEREQGENHPNLLNDEKLEAIQDPQSNSDLQKAIQVLRDNGVGIALSELINHEKRKREIRANKRKEGNIYQGMVEIKDSEMGSFNPHDYSLSNSTMGSGIFQSMVGVQGLKMRGDFKPQRGLNKEVVETMISKDITESKYESQLITELRKKQILSQEEINRVNDYLKTKKTFLQARQQTIEELQNCLNELEKKFGKHAIISEVGNA